MMIIGERKKEKRKEKKQQERSRTSFKCRKSSNEFVDPRTKSQVGRDKTLFVK